MSTKDQLEQVGGAFCKFSSPLELLKSGFLSDWVCTFLHDYYCGWLLLWHEVLSWCTAWYPIPPLHQELLSWNHQPDVWFWSCQHLITSWVTGFEWWSCIHNSKQLSINFWVAPQLDNMQRHHMNTMPRLWCSQPQGSHPETYHIPLNATCSCVPKNCSYPALWCLFVQMMSMPKQASPYSSGYGD
jgi:hypothetical protein